MFRIVAVQCIASLVVAAGAAAIAGSQAAWTALLGGLACALPNGLFALHLANLGRLRKQPGARAGSASASAMTILVGEVSKVALTIGLLALLVLGFRGVVWPALIVSVGAVMLIQPLAMAWRHD
jgi:ATP synthase protein I